MKRIIMIAMAGAALTMAACSNKNASNASGQKESTEVAQEAPEATGTVYKSEKYGCSVTLPKEFKMNEGGSLDEGGAIFTCGQNMVTIDIAPVEKEMTPQDLKAKADEASTEMGAGEELISKRVEDDMVVFKVKSAEGYTAICIRYFGKHAINLGFSYDTAHKKEFDEQVDQVIGSFKTK